MKDIISLTMRSSVITMRIQNLTKRACQWVSFGSSLVLIYTRSPSKHTVWDWTGKQGLSLLQNPGRDPNFTEMWWSTMVDLYRVTHQCNTHEASLLCAGTNFYTKVTTTETYPRASLRGRLLGHWSYFFPNISHVNVPCLLHILYCCLSILIKNHF